MTKDTLGQLLIKYRHCYYILGTMENKVGHFKERRLIRQKANRLSRRIVSKDYRI